MKYPKKIGNNEMFLVNRLCESNFIIIIIFPGRMIFLKEVKTQSEDGSSFDKVWHFI